MPSPSASLATLRPDLGASLVAFDLAMGQKGFIGQLVAPKFSTMTAAGIFGKVSVANMLQARNTKRMSRSGYSRQNWEFTSDTFQTVEYGAEEVVDDRDERLYGNFFAAETMAASRARDVVLRNYEKRVADLIFNTATWTGSSLTTAVGTAWSTTATATPIADVKAAKGKVWDNIGLQANTLIINYHVFLNLQQNADLISRIKYAGIQDPNTKAITAAAMAQAFGLDRILVSGSQYNSAKEGQTAVLSPLWADADAMVCYTAQTQDIQEPCIARTLAWEGDGGTLEGTMETYRDETVRADIVRCRQETMEKVLITEAGHLLTNVT